MRKTKHALFRHAKLGSRRLIVPMSQKVATMYSERALPLLGTWGCKYSPRLVNRMLGFFSSAMLAHHFRGFGPILKPSVAIAPRPSATRPVRPARIYRGVGLMSHLHPAKYRAIDLLLMELN